MQIATCLTLWWHLVFDTYFSGWVDIGLMFCRPFSEPSSKVNSTPHTLRLSTVLGRGFKGSFLVVMTYLSDYPTNHSLSPSDSSLPVSQEFLAPLLSGVASLGPCPSLDVALCQRNGSGEVNFLRDWMFLSVFILLSPLIGFLLDVQVGHHFPAALDARTHCSLLVSRDTWSHSDSWSYCFFGGLVCLWYHNSHPLGFWMGLCSLLLSGPQGYLSLFFWDAVSLCSSGKLWTYLCFCLPALGL